MEHPKPNQIDLSALAEKWPSGIVPREKVGDFTGGLLSPGYLANLDSIGEGPESFRIGRKRVYSVPALIKWLEKRATHIKPRRVHQHQDR
ncbi:hypothetical protein Dvar_45120 [Desulfosarcina variabilis str. Montpellier]|uniref:hypothetical protein n=1 Tax=Desulfosarcina variabilis TaxID=2300 RepID=UPI003AFB0720